MSLNKQFNEFIDNSTQVMTINVAQQYFQMLIQNPSDKSVLIENIKTFINELNLKPDYLQIVNNDLEKLYKLLNSSKIRFDLIHSHCQRRKLQLDIGSRNAIFKTYPPIEYKRFELHDEAWLGFEKIANLTHHLFNSQLLLIDELKQKQLNNSLPVSWFYRSVYTNILTPFQKKILEQNLADFNYQWLKFEVNILTKQQREECDQLIYLHESKNHGVLSALFYIYTEILEKEQQSYFQQQFPFYYQWINTLIEIQISEEEIIEIDDLLNRFGLGSFGSQAIQLNRLVAGHEESLEGSITDFATSTTFSPPLNSAVSTSLSPSSPRLIKRKNKISSSQEEDEEYIPHAKRKKSSYHRASIISNKLTADTLTQIDAHIVRITTQFKNTLTFGASNTVGFQKTYKHKKDHKKYLLNVLLISPPDQSSKVMQISTGQAIYQRIKELYLPHLQASAFANCILMKTNSSFTYSESNQFRKNDGTFVGYVIPPDAPLGTVAIRGPSILQLNNKCTSYPFSTLIENNNSDTEDEEKIEIDDDEMTTLEEVKKNLLAQTAPREDSISTSSNQSFNLLNQLRQGSSLTPINHQAQESCSTGTRFPSFKKGNLSE